MRACECNKGTLIRELMQQNGWTRDVAIFFDDTATHIAEAKPYCRTFQVSSRAHGLQAEEIQEIRRAISL